MNYKASFPSINEEVSREEWHMIYHHITARVPGPEHHLLINLYGLRSASAWCATWGRTTR